MTVEELLDNLRDEWASLENKFIPAYEALGRSCDYYRKDLADVKGISGIQTNLASVEYLRTRQSEITELIADIKKIRDNSGGRG